MCYGITNARRAGKNTKAAVEAMHTQLTTSGIEKFDDVAAYLCKKYSIQNVPPGVTPLEFAIFSSPSGETSED